MENFDPLDTDDDLHSEQQAMKDANQLEQETEVADFKWMMSGPRGRRFIWRQLTQSGVFLSSFNPEAMQMAYNEGFRNAGLKLLNQVQTLCPELYSTMMQEQQR